jgi:hypothetical protein
MGEGEEQLRASAYLWGDKGRDFLGGLGPFLKNLFEWLDDLQDGLEQVLTERSQALGFDCWVELKRHVDRHQHYIRLPWVGVDWKDGRRYREIRANFLYLPICDGSDPFD